MLGNVILKIIVLFVQIYFSPFLVTNFTFLRCQINQINFMKVDVD